MFNDVILYNKPSIEKLVTPLTPYLICNHFFATEIHPNSGHKYIKFRLRVKANDLIRNRNFGTIKNYDVVLVQVDLFDLFYDRVLPLLIKNNIKIILITSQLHLPQIHRNDKTDSLINSENIILWISQNPIYTNNEKYMAFPYGIRQDFLDRYVSFVRHYKDETKINKILNQQSSVHKHLPEDHIRRLYPIFGEHSGQRLDYDEFLDKISKSEFVISTSGDRDDCYRHYESIGLNAIPVSNIGGGYKDIFEDNMIYSTAEEMVNMVETNQVNYEYKNPNRDILTIVYWIKKINEKVNALLQRNK